MRSFLVLIGLSLRQKENLNDKENWSRLQDETSYRGIFNIFHFSLRVLSHIYNSKKLFSSNKSEVTFVKLMKPFFTLVLK